jgi:hypothetical protein
MTRKMKKWSLELSEFVIKFEECKALKARVLVGFIAKMTISLEEKTNGWIIYMDGSSDSRGSSACIIHKNGGIFIVKVSLGCHSQHPTIK